MANRNSLDDLLLHLDGERIAILSIDNDDERIISLYDLADKLFKDPPNNNPIDVARVLQGLKKIVNYIINKAEERKGLH
jgi:hypothetical protein|tara:strand:- start:9 stop:245 length:237 start_codon:yes stop_codon:yes gene_type:complete